MDAWHGRLRIMRKGVVILRPPIATLELQGQAKKMLVKEGFNCESKHRFDGVMIVAFEKAEEQPESSCEEVEGALRNNSLLHHAAFEIKEHG
jgi:hypothetical protein